MTIYLIECSETDAVFVDHAFPDSLAAWRYCQRFGKPGWQPFPVELLNRTEVDALPREQPALALVEA